MGNTTKQMNEQLKNEPVQLKTQLDAVVYFIQKLDIDMVNEILDDELTYQDFEKAMFIHKLGVAFDEFKSVGNESLEVSYGMCDSIKCSYGCPGYQFVGNHSPFFFELIFIHKEGQIQDIYECVDFKAEKSSNRLEDRIEIDKSNNLF